MKRVAFALVTVILLGAFGYNFIEKMSLPDAVFSTLSVMSTNGAPSGLSSNGKIFTSALIVASIGLVVAAVAKLASGPVQGQEQLLTGFFSSVAGSGDMIMKEVKVGKNLAGKSKAQILQDFGLVLVGIKGKNGFEVDVPLNVKAKKGSSVLLLGSPTALRGI